MKQKPIRKQLCPECLKKYRIFENARRNKIRRKQRSANNKIKTKNNMKIEISKTENEIILDALEYSYIERKDWFVKKGMDMIYNELKKKIENME